MPDAIRYHRDLTFAYGEAATVSPLVRRVIARNPSAFTFHGTGTYIVGRGKVAVIDPGPDLAEHAGALLKSLANETVTHILITHTHADHSPGAKALKAATGAPTYGFGPHPVGPDGPRVEEGGDYAFRPDVTIGEGAVIAGQGWTFDALHTPGHISNHLCFALREARALFSGDHVMGWSTSVISPPEGDMADYFASLRKLLPRDDLLYFPTHGPPVPEPREFVRAFIAHRQEREAQIMRVLARGPAAIPAMVAEIYRDVPKHLHRAAARSVLAHLVHMQVDGRVARSDGPAEDAIYRLA
jgi:glyoxylase-like metal-dependent hydrolase (beta-lactamase superfamily II)